MKLILRSRPTCPNILVVLKHFFFLSPFSFKCSYSCSLMFHMIYVLSSWLWVLYFNESRCDGHSTANCAVAMGWDEKESIIIHYVRVYEGLWESQPITLGPFMPLKSSAIPPNCTDSLVTAFLRGNSIMKKKKYIYIYRCTKKLKA